MSRSIVEYFPDSPSSSGRSCGYCKGESSSVSKGMWTHFLAPQDYQDLIDRGWRRSGKYCYKPAMQKTCCPQYTIRCHAPTFRPSKSQKKVVKRFRNYILNGGNNDGKEVLVGPTVTLPSPPAPPVSNSDFDDANSKKIVSGHSATAPPCDSASGSQMVEEAEKNVNIIDKPDVESDDKLPKRPRKGDGPDPSKPKAKKAKEMRKERALLKKQSEQQPTPATIGGEKVKDKNQQATIEDLVSFIHSDDGTVRAHRFKMVMVKSDPENPWFSKTFNESHELYKKYQVAVHEDDPGDVDSAQFKRFICDSPIVSAVHPEGGGGGSSGEGLSYMPESFGTYHMQYWLDNKLVCVGALDVLPFSVSSVYLYYDPDFSFLSFGTLSAILEIVYTRHLWQCWSRSIEYYYMGYYIHSCPKMRYKAQYDPSWLLCPQTFDWVILKLCLPLLDKAKYSRLNPSVLPPDQTAVKPEKSNLATVSILHRRQVMPYYIYNRHFNVNNDEELSGEDREVAEYYTLVGHKVSRNMLLYRA